MQQNTHDGEGLLCKREAAKLLNVSPRTVDLWLKQRRIPYMKLGNTKGSLVRFKRSDLDAMLERFRVN